MCNVTVFSALNQMLNCKSSPICWKDDGISGPRRKSIKYKFVFRKMLSRFSEFHKFQCMCQKVRGVSLQNVTSVIFAIVGFTKMETFLWRSMNEQFIHQHPLPLSELVEGIIHENIYSVLRVYSKLAPLHIHTTYTHTHMWEFFSIGKKNDIGWDGYSGEKSYYFYK